MVLEKDVPMLKKHLSLVADQDYFEKGIENMIRQESSEFIPVYTKGLFCAEVDFPEDLDVVQKFLKTSKERITTSTQ